MADEIDDLEEVRIRAQHDLGAAATAWEAGDYRSARAALERVAADDLQPDQRAVQAQIAHGLAFDPAILTTGVLLLAVWVWLFGSVAPG